MSQAQAIHKVNSIRRQILKAIKDYDSPKLLLLIDILDYECEQLIGDLPTWTSPKGGTWRERLKEWRDEARDAYECF